MSTVILTLFILVSIYLLIIWTTHISMVKDNTSEYGWANYQKFKKQFDSRNWDDEDWYEFGLWDRLTQSQFHASIIRFDGKGMIINNPLGYILAELHAKKYYNRHFKSKEPKRNVVKW